MASKRQASQCNFDNTCFSVDQVAKLFEVDDLPRSSTLPSDTPPVNIQFDANSDQSRGFTSCDHPCTDAMLQGTASNDTFNNLESSTHFGDPSRKNDLSLLPASTVSSDRANMPIPNKEMKLLINKAKTTISPKANILLNKAQTVSNNAANYMQSGASKYTSLPHTNNVVDNCKDDSLSKALKVKKNGTGNSIMENTIAVRNAIIESVESFTDDVISSPPEDHFAAEGFNVNTPMQFGASETQSPALKFNLVDCSWDDTFLKDSKANDKADSSVAKNTFDPRNVIIQPVDYSKDNVISSIRKYPSDAEELHVNAFIPISASDTPSSAHESKALVSSLKYMKKLPNKETAFSLRLAKQVMLLEPTGWVSDTKKLEKLPTHHEAFPSTLVKQVVELESTVDVYDQQKLEELPKHIETGLNEVPNSKTHEKESNIKALDLYFEDAKLKDFPGLLEVGSNYENSKEQSENLSQSEKTIVPEISNSVIDSLQFCSSVSNEIDSKENAHELPKSVSTFPKHVIDEVTELMFQDTRPLSEEPNVIKSSQNFDEKLVLPESIKQDVEESLLSSVSSVAKRESVNNSQQSSDMFTGDAINSSHCSLVPHNSLALNQDLANSGR